MNVDNAKIMRVSAEIIGSLFTYAGLYYIFLISHTLNSAIVVLVACYVIDMAITWLGYEYELKHSPSEDSENTSVCNNC